MLKSMRPIRFNAYVLGAIGTVTFLLILWLRYNWGPGGRGLDFGPETVLEKEEKEGPRLDKEEEEEEEKEEEEKEEEEKPVAGGKKVQLDVYSEALCPDTTRFFTHELEPLYKSELFEFVNLTIIPFGKAACRKVTNDFVCTCQHGQAECAMNRLQNCVIQKIEDVELSSEIVVCLQGNHVTDSTSDKCLSDAFPSGPEKAKKIVACAEGLEGKELLFLAGEKTKKSAPNLSFVPWVMINGKRDVDYFYALKKAVCDHLETEKKPNTCDDVE